MLSTGAYALSHNLLLASPGVAKALTSADRVHAPRLFQFSSGNGEIGMRLTWLTG